MKLLRLKSLGQVFGFLFCCAFVWAIVKRKPSWAIISITMVITVGSIGAIRLVSRYFFLNERQRQRLRFD